MGEGGTSVVLNDASVTVCTGLGHIKCRTEIPYDQLTTVIYLRPTLDGWRNGALLFRGEINKNAPISETRRLEFDNAAVKFALNKDASFYHIFQMLKAVASPSARFEMIIPEVKIKKLDELAHVIDMEHLWNIYAPDRERAASGICAKHGIKPKEARALIDKEFDAKQEILYKADPLDAIRDLNFLIGNIQNISRLKAELKEYQKQKEIEKSLEHIELMMLDKIDK